MKKEKLILEETFDNYLKLLHSPKMLRLVASNYHSDAYTYTYFDEYNQLHVGLSFNRYEFRNEYDYSLFFFKHNGTTKDVRWIIREFLQSIYFDMLSNRYDEDITSKYYQILQQELK